ncbi:hypothetical protein AQI88_37185 [Streptomyces cellostaticus]|uniref:DUF4190 domain-containing protein n=1 Tax=Streptomyces cellostaticus TaxID=67285 RepID=A0A101NDY6_9ACTN|nr:DUF4190 domain-containing protein [Streptomyces cellostaticus]KUM91389.1 hypothetical protein AQI88_37185 [Streptomyces cellostaticus]
MTDRTQPGAGEGAGFDPWAPPESKPSLDKGAPQPPVQDQQPPVRPPSLHDQATMMSMPGSGFGAPGFGPPGAAPGQSQGQGQGWSESAVPPPPVAPPAPGAPGAAGPAAPGGYGYPGYPQGYGWPGMPMAPQNGTGTAAMVLGILSCCLFCLYGVVSLVLGVIAVILGVKGKRRAERGEATNHGQAQAGLITGIIGIVLGIAIIAFLAVAIAFAIKDGKNHDTDSGPSYNSAPRVSAPVLTRG